MGSDCKLVWKDGMAFKKLLLYSGYLDNSGLLHPSLSGTIYEERVWNI